MQPFRDNATDGLLLECLTLTYNAVQIASLDLSTKGSGILDARLNECERRVDTRLGEDKLEGSPLGVGGATPTNPTKASRPG